MDAVQSINLISINPKIRRGRPYILGTTVTVADVVMAKLFHKRDPDQTAEDYQLTLSQVYSALAYYYDHKDEIDQSIRDQVRRAHDLKEHRVGNEGSLLP